MLWPEDSRLFSARMSFHRGAFASTKHDVKPVAQRLRRNGGFPIELRNKPVPRLFIVRAVEDRIEGNQRIALEIHLRHKPRRESRAEQRKMNVRRPPGIVVISPRIFPRPNCDEAIAAIGIRHRMPATSKVGVERSVVLIDAVEITSCGIRLPDFRRTLF